MIRTRNKTRAIVDPITPLNKRKQKLAIKAHTAPTKETDQLPQELYETVVIQK